MRTLVIIAFLLMPPLICSAEGEPTKAEILHDKAIRNVEAEVAQLEARIKEHSKKNKRPEISMPGMPGISVPRESMEERRYFSGQAKVDLQKRKEYLDYLRKGGEPTWTSIDFDFSPRNSKAALKKGTIGKLDKVMFTIYQIIDEESCLMDVPVDQTYGPGSANFIVHCSTDGLSVGGKGGLPGIWEIEAVSSLPKKIRYGSEGGYYTVFDTIYVVKRLDR